MDDRGSIPGRDFFFSLLCPNQLWSPPNLMANGYREVMRPGREAYHSISLRDVVLN